MAVKPIPEGYHSITPYLTVNDAAGLIRFLERAFAATVKERMARPDGSVMHAEMRIGDSLVMLGQGAGESKARPSTLYLYVEDVDATWKRAIEAGAKPLREVRDEFYGDRSGGVTDPAGNDWYIATHKEDVSPEELQRRAAAMGRQQGG